MFDILISENIQGVALDALRERFHVSLQPEIWKSPPKLESEIRSCRALMVRNQTPVTAELLACAPELLVVGRAGVGLDNIDVKAAEHAGIVIASTPDQNAISAAELTIGMILALARMIPAANRDTRQGNWSRQKFVGIELYGKTLGVVGAGKIGFLTARRAIAFGMKILAYDPYLSPDNVLLSDLRAELVTLEELLSTSDVVTCHLPATRETKGLMNSAHFARMKQGALFINTSRGSIVVEPDLVAALKSGALGGAALDVRGTEPPVVSELEALPNVILTPHIAAFTREAQDRVTRAVCEDVARVLDGKPAINAVGCALPRKPATK